MFRTMLVDSLKCDRKEKLETKEKFRLQLKLNLIVRLVGIFFLKNEKLNLNFVMLI